MKKTFILLVLIILSVGCSKEKSNLTGKYISIKDTDNYIEIYDNGNCYYSPYSSAETYDCKYFKNENTIRIEYSYYNVISERETTDSITFEIEENNLKYDNTMFYKN